MICSIGAVSATDLNDNSTVEVTSSVDDSISVDEASIIDVGQNQDVASTSAATWDELKTACQSSGDKVITLTGQSYNANSQIVFGNSATIIGSSDTTENTVQISAGNYTFENNTFINCNQTIRGVNNTFINCTPEDSNLLKSLNIQSIRLNQPIVANPDDNVTSPQWAMTGHDAQNSGQSPYNGIFKSSLEQFISFNFKLYYR